MRLIGLVVKWISHVSSEHGFGVRVPTRPPKKLYRLGYPKNNLFVRNTNIKAKTFYKTKNYEKQDSQIYGKRLIIDH